nr:hypothetical protein Iba_chr13aCG9550 [Ipomoea batatas]
MEPARLLLSYGLQWSVGRTKMASLVCKEEMEPARLLLSYGLRWSVGRTKMASLVCFLKIQKTRRKGRIILHGIKPFQIHILPGTRHHRSRPAVTLRHSSSKRSQLSATATAIVGGSSPPR